MNILLAANRVHTGPRPIGGVQSWCRTVASELQRRGHDVTMWEPSQPLIAQRYDLGVLAHARFTASAVQYCARVLNVCHGIIPHEHPSTGLVAYTSEEVRGHWQGVGPILRQPIDLEFWTPARLPRRYLTRFSYHSGLGFAASIARAMRVRYQHIRHMDMRAARMALRRSVCVLASGRAALEAMACGVPVVLCDHRCEYQGPLLDLDTTGAMVRNYSGRGGIAPTPDNVRQAIDVAVTNGSLRDHVRRYHDVEIIVNELLELAA